MAYVLGRLVVLNLLDECCNGLLNYVAAVGFYYVLWL